jgi:hypothetical protein
VKKASAALALAILVSSAPAAASRDPAFEPLAFLAGHCWRGTLPGTSDVGEAIDFPAAKLVGAARTVGFRGSWKRLGDDGYEVLREYETPKGWVPVVVQMRKVRQ